MSLQSDIIEEIRLGLWALGNNAELRRLFSYKTCEKLSMAWSFSRPLADFVGLLAGGAILCTYAGMLLFFPCGILNRVSEQADYRSSDRILHVVFFSAFLGRDFSFFTIGSYSLSRLVDQMIQDWLIPIIGFIRCL